MNQPNGMVLHNFVKGNNKKHKSRIFSNQSNAKKSVKVDEITYNKQTNSLKLRRASTHKRSILRNFKANKEIYGEVSITESVIGEHHHQVAESSRPIIVAYC